MGDHLPTKNYQLKTTNSFNGFGLVEVVLGVAILAMVLVGAVSVAQKSLALNRQALLETQAGFLTAEGAEIARIFRDTSFTNISGLTAGTNYYFTWTGTAWATTTSSSAIDSTFYRKMIISNVYRDSNNDIVTSGGTLDTGTRKVRIETGWLSGFGSSTKAIELYIANI